MGMFTVKHHCLCMRRRASFGTVGFLMLCVFFAGTKEAISAQIDAVQIATERSARYLVNNTRKDGMFQYRINMDSTIEVKDGYNILRHAGTIYAMSMYYKLKPDVSMRSAIKRSGRYLRDEAIHPVSGKHNVLAVWSEPDVNRKGKPLQAKLGGTGLGLVALLSLEDIHPEFTPLSDLQALGRFVVYMQKEWDKWQSLFYPGEAALGLLMLYEKDSSEVWFESAARALAYMAHSRENSTDIPVDHWALLATEKILSLNNSDKLPVSRELLINHAIQICEAILRDQIKNPERPEYDGGFSEDGRITPTAIRLEGLQAALSFLPANHEIRRRIDSALPRGLSFLLRAQIKKGKFSGALPRAVEKIDRAIPGVDKFNRRATEVRIDYVQHALSAMIQYLNLMNDNK